jgi:hypothetical protein
MELIVRANAHLSVSDSDAKASCSSRLDTAFSSIDEDDEEVCTALLPGSTAPLDGDPNAAMLALVPIPPPLMPPPPLVPPLPMLPLAPRDQDGRLLGSPAAELELSAPPCPCSCPRGVSGALLCRELAHRSMYSTCYERNDNDK